MIIERFGNILNVKTGLIAHGVNCKGVFGAGLALQIRKKYPSVYYEYVRKHQETGWQLGEVQIVDVEESDTPLKIANLATQKGYGYTDHQKVFADYSAIQDAFITLCDYCKRNNLVINIPKIGAGLAGGDWKEIKQRIELAQSIHPVGIILYQLGV